MAKDKETKEPKEPRTKQTFIKGTEPPIDEAIENAAEELDDEKKAAAKARVVVKEIEQKLADVMKARKITFYHRGKVKAVLKSSDKVTVTIGKEKGEKDE